MESLGNLAAVAPMNFDGNIEVNWRLFKEEFNCYRIATGYTEKSEIVQCNLLLHLIGRSGRDVYRSFTLAESEQNKIEILLNKFEEYFVPKVNITVERFKFFSCKQADKQSIDDFVKELRNKAANCDFGPLNNGLIRDVLVLNTNNTYLRERFLRIPDLSLEKALELGRSVELAAKHEELLRKETSASEEGGKILKIKGAISNRPNSTSSEIRGAANTSNTKTISKSNNKQNTYHPKSQDNVCTRCGRKHGQKCPATGKNCNKCGRPNHFANCCRTTETKNVNNIEIINKNKNGSEKNNNRSHMIGTLQNPKDYNDCWSVTLNIHGVNTKFKIDTGAEVNCISLTMVNKIFRNKPIINKTDCVLSGYAGYKLQPKGSCMVACKYKGGEYNVKFYVFDEKGATCVLGLESSQKLKLIRRVDNLSLTNGCKPLIQKYKTLFEGYGEIKNKTYKIELKKNAVPIIQAPRKIPFSLLENLKKELSNMIENKIIEKVSEPTEWVNAIVIVKRSDGNIRLCMDPRPLNQWIKREHFHLPTLDEITANFKDAKYFTTLDAYKGFWQLKLDAESSKLCTFATPLGRYRFLRLPFGINSAPEIFQKTMQDILHNIEGVHVYIDDIIITASNKEEHDSRLEKVFKRLLLNGIRLNEEKCKFLKKEIAFLGHIFSEKGMTVDHNKTKAVRDMSEPTDVKSLQRFIGMVNYLNKFIPHFADLTEVLRTLLKKKTAWHWEKEHSTAFNKLKQALTESPTLAYYNVNLPVILSVDASKSATGAVLLQNNRPIAYASKSMTSCQQNYAQIEKELLAIVQGCEKFHQYIYGKSIIVETDHKPLVHLQDKPLNECPLRLQRMFLRLQVYDLTLKYRPGKELVLADGLSRILSISREKERECTIEEKVESQVGLIFKNITLTVKQFEDIKKKTLDDETLKVVMKFTKQGWPRQRNQMSTDVQKYFDIRDNISIYRNILLFNDRIIIPKVLRQVILERLHLNHGGLTKSKAKAREVVYWPELCDDIDHWVRSCSDCQRMGSANKPEPLVQHKIPDRPWTKLAMDLFQIKERHYLLIVDYYSKYFEVAYLPETDSETVIKNCKHAFSRFGIPETVMTDNGPQFRSKNFKEFVEVWEFEHITSSPYYPQSNGQAERFVKTIKDTLMKCVTSETDPYLAMLELRNTPNPTGAAPTELMFGRKINGHFPTKYNKRKSIKQKEHERVLKKVNDRTVRNYNEGTKDLKMLKPGQLVWFQNGRYWEKAKVDKQLTNKRSYLLLANNGSKHIRNRRFLKEYHERKSEYLPQVKNEESKTRWSRTILEDDDQEPEGLVPSDTPARRSSDTWTSWRSPRTESSSSEEDQEEGHVEAETESDGSVTRESTMTSSETSAESTPDPPRTVTRYGRDVRPPVQYWKASHK